MLVAPLRRMLDRSAQRGQVMVELAFILPILTIMGFGVFECGRGFQAQLALTHAARDGARVAVDPASNNDAKIIDTVNKAAAPLVPSSIAITRPSGRVSVRVTYNFDSVIPMIDLLWGGGTLVIGHTAVSRVG